MRHSSRPLAALILASACQPSLPSTLHVGWEPGAPDILTDASAWSVDDERVTITPRQVDLGSLRNKFSWDAYRAIAESDWTVSATVPELGWSVSDATAVARLRPADAPWRVLQVTLNSTAPTRRIIANISDSEPSFGEVREGTTVLFTWGSDSDSDVTRSPTTGP